MTDLNIITIVSGLLLVVLVVITEAYWLDAREFYYKAMDSRLPKSLRLEAIDNFRSSILMFRIASAVMFLALLFTLLPIYFADFPVTTAKLLLGVVSGLLLVFLGKLALGKLSIKYSSPYDLLKNAVDKADKQ